MNGWKRKMWWLSMLLLLLDPVAAAAAEPSSATTSTSISDNIPATEDIDNNTNASLSMCKLWAQRQQQHGGFEFDVVALTDDADWGLGRAEDMALIRALRKLGRTATRMSIQDDDFDWTSTKMIVVRSAWNKYEYFDEYWEFLLRSDKHAILMNPLSVMEFQMKKDVYLNLLAKAGINIPPIYVVTPNDFQDGERPGPEDVEEALEVLGCEFVVVKPSHGNGGVGVRLLGEDPDFMKSFQLIIESDEDHAMFQCYQDSIEETGERGVVFVGGEVSHGISKIPKEGHYMVNTDFGGTWTIYKPTPQEATFAKNVASKINDIIGVTPAYLRVDVFDDNDGNLALMELAAGTADLHLKDAPQAAQHFAAYLDAQLKAKEIECESLQSQSEEEL